MKFQLGQRLKEFHGYSAPLSTLHGFMTARLHHSVMCFKRSALNVMSDDAYREAASAEPVIAGGGGFMTARMPSSILRRLLMVISAA